MTKKDKPIEYQYFCFLKDQHGNIRVSVPCTSYIQDKQGQLLWLEIVTSAVQAFNAIRANIYKNRRTTVLVKTDVFIRNMNNNYRQYLSVIPKTKYDSTVIGNHMVFSHEGFNRTSNRYLLGGNESDPAPMFYRAVQTHLNVPYLDGWASELWSAGIENKLINKLIEAGEITAWVMSHDNQRWVDLIQNLRQSGGLLTPKEKIL